MVCRYTARAAPMCWEAPARTKWEHLGRWMANNILRVVGLVARAVRGEDRWPAVSSDVVLAGLQVAVIGYIWVLSLESDHGKKHRDKFCNLC